MAWLRYVILRGWCTYKANFRQREKAAVYSDISRTSTANLRPSLGEDALLHELVAQFLAHDGYIETARAFAEEVAAETAALNGHGDPLKKYEVEEDLEAINRQSECFSLTHPDQFDILTICRNPSSHFGWRYRQSSEIY